MKLFSPNPNLIRPLILILICFTINSCKRSVKKAKTFSGEEEIVKLAEQMIKANGGKEAWCNLKSLYIKAEHNEPQMAIPYQSEIWRDIEQFDLVIEQKNDSFHAKAVINKFGGSIRYYDKRDTIRTLTENQLKEWEFENEHNIYVLLHNLSCTPQKFEVKVDTENRLSFYRDTIFYASFELDDQLRPYKFYIPNIEGKITGSIFTHWGIDEGLVHSAGGHPMDSSFTYRTEIWKPSEKSLKLSLEESLFIVE